jgi:O-antigen/teichoic acid export membrane protein
LYLVIASLFFTVGGLIIAPYLGLIKTDYIPSQVPLQILVLSFPIFFLTSALSWLLFVQKKEKTLVWVYGLSFIINAVANFAFIPYFGYLASSWITVFGEVLILLMLVVIIRMNNDKA